MLLSSRGVVRSYDCTKGSSENAVFNNNVLKIIRGRNDLEKNRSTVALSLVSSLRLCLCSGVAPVYSSGQAPGLGKGAV